MKNFLYGIYLLISLYSKAQVTAPDFTMTDISGNTYHLYDELDLGKYVILDFFTTTCGTCQQNTSILATYWNQHGYQGDSCWIWSIEENGVADSVIGHFFETYPAGFPAFGTSANNAVLALYQVTYAPMYVAVCPDRYMKAVSISAIQDNQISCGSASSEKDNKFENPNVFVSHDYLCVSNISSLTIPVTIEIYSSNGKKLKHAVGVGSLFQVSVSDLPEGIFFYGITLNSGMFHGKFFR